MIIDIGLYIYIYIYISIYIFTYTHRKPLTVIPLNCLTIKTKK